MNTFGQLFRLTTFGESHGPAIGGIIDGMPPRVPVDLDLLRQAMLSRSPQGKPGTTARREPDEVELLSGIYNGLTLGTPIGFLIRNKDARSNDYAATADVYRPNHADFTYDAKYGIRDPRGGGRASARETACRVVGGAFAEMVLRTKGISVSASIISIGGGTDFEEVLDKARRDCDSVGGVIECTITGVPAGLGEPVFDKLQARLAEAMMSIPAAKGFDYGSGFDAASDRGSNQADEFFRDADGTIRTRTNHSGGIQGGISNGMPIYFRVAFKPIATMPGRTLNTVDSAGRPCTITASGRHDVSAVPRAVAVVKAMAAMTILDSLLLL